MPLAIQYQDPETGATTTDHFQTPQEMRERMWKKKIKPDNPTLIVWFTIVNTPDHVPTAPKPVRPRGIGTRRGTGKKKEQPLTCGDIWNRYESMTEVEEANAILEMNQI